MKTYKHLPVRSGVKLLLLLETGEEAKLYTAADGVVWACVVHPDRKPYSINLNTGERIDPVTNHAH